MATLKKYLFLSAEGSLCVRSDAKSSSHSPLEDFVGEAISLPLFSGGASPSPTLRFEKFMLHLLKYIEWANFISHSAGAEYFTKIGLSSNPNGNPQKISFPISRRLTLRAKRRKIKFTFAARRFCRGGYQPPAFFGRSKPLPYFTF